MRLRSGVRISELKILSGNNKFGLNKGAATPGKTDTGYSLNTIETISCIILLNAAAPLACPAFYTITKWYLIGW